jgi:N6-L-threonylcarbamoyladenine synthase
MNILAIETSCDETSVAVVKDGVDVLSLSIASSQALHAQSGGIIPEKAARKQVEYMLPTLSDALKTAFPDISPNDNQSYFDQIDKIAVTVGPGLIGSLLIGVETAKTLATLYNKPLIPVNHMEAHLYANWINKKEEIPLPCLGLIVSGGHTDIVLITSHTDIKRIAGTRDDAAGECFDKCARLLGLGYPGGPAIGKAAELFMKEDKEKKLTYFPRALSHDQTLDVSFSGLKAAVSREVAAHSEADKNELAAEIQEAIIDTLLTKFELAMRLYPTSSVLICGGVTANSRLREKFTKMIARLTPQLQAYMPDILYCTDNAAMVGARAFFSPETMPVASVSANPELHF